ncbi:MAG: formate dehydrogenase subunit alpha [Rhodospirillales bacterium]|nr:formate dehydrogenase subunit alpha [Rhodospirillales bacterium]MDH3911347.1 formate dehydrogenase subunit alpha [Rhodospirillales bacterium]MDH3968221.1 formate dehydrogenase subunit alpha [Rhodospirillales bacterium]
MPNLTVNGRTVTVEAGKTVLDACRTAEVYVPTLCDDPELEPYGACRLCIVKVEGMRGLPTACTTPAAEDMKVTTEDPEILEVRQWTAQLLLADHPLDCLTCAQCGACGLQDVAAHLGIRDRVLRPMERDAKIDNSNACFAIDMRRCILCGLCVRACDEIQHLGAIDLVKRGYASAVEPFGGGPIKDSICETCGECVERCPTGALTARQYLRPEREVSTVCPYCGTGCRIILGARGDTVVSARGDMDAPISRGRLCVKGRFGSFEFVSHPDRLKTPLIRTADGFREASWEEALALVARELKKYRGDAFGGLASAKVTNEDNYLFQKFVRAAMGTNNVDHCARLCHSSTVAGLRLSFGSGAMTNPADDLLNTEVILVTGSNTTENHPIIGLKIREAVARGAKLLVFDPRQIQLSQLATVWARQRPGTDVAWINGLIHVIIRDGLMKTEFIEARTEGFEAVEKLVAAYTPERVSEITGVPAGLIVEAAHVYATAERASIVYSMGITQHTTGVDNVRSLANLAMITGQIGRPGTGVNPLRGQSNVQGACDMGALPNFYTGYQDVADAEVRAKFEKAWNAALSETPGLTVTKMLPAALEGKIKALYVMGENPVLSDADVTHVVEALENLEFLVVQDIFLTETAKLADVVLPASSYAERDGTYTNTERRVQLTMPVVPPPGQARRDLEIICELATAVGYPMSYASTAEINDEMRSLTPSYAGISHARLEAGEQLHWPCPTEDHPGTPILHRDKFARGLGQFHPVEYKPAAEETDASFPIVLTTGRMLEHYHTGTMTRRSDGLNGLVPGPFVEVNGADAKKIRVKDGERVKVTSRRGSIVLPAKVGTRVDTGVLFIPFHFWEAAANVLTNPASDPTAGIPEFKVCAVRLERAPELAGSR